jgi:hypothetical protein
MSGSAARPDIKGEIRKLNLAVQRAPRHKRALIADWWSGC